MRTKIKPELTPAVTYLRGKYALSEYQIPYYSTVLPMSFVAEKFTLVDEIPESERIDWSIDELFQREIAWERIDEELVTYLKNENRPQFFNALTIALLPTKGHGLDAHFDNDNSYDPMDEDDLDEPIQIGGVQIQSFIDTDGDAGRIRWNKNKVIAVAVDGQHRLAAIKKFQSQTDKHKLDNTSIPVILLIPDERIGYIEPEQLTGEKSVIASLRRVFIDLNKNARSVSRARNILLDDIDISSVCVRSLIGEKLSSAHYEDRIPLPVVDWVSEKNKFETGPFITTILLLHDLVIHLLNSKKFDDYVPQEEYDIDIESWIKSKFNPSDVELERIMSSAQRCFFRQVPLTFQQNEINVLKVRFEKIWRPLVSKLFNELKPYKELLDFGKKYKLHDPEFVNLFIATDIMKGQNAKDRAEKIKDNNKLNDERWDYSKNYEEPLIKINTELKHDNWAYKVVFQKAMFLSFVTLLQQADDFVDEYTNEYDKNNKMTDMWIEAINHLFDKGFGYVYKPVTGKDYFWAGIVLGADDNIEYTKIASKRISNWLSAWVYMYWMDEVLTYNKLKKSEEIIMKSCFKLLDRSGIKKLVNARNENSLEGDELNDEIDLTIDKRYKLLKKAIN